MSKMISSLKRDWNEKKEETEILLTEEDWPESPPRKKLATSVMSKFKQNEGFSNSVASKPVATGNGDWRNESTTSKAKPLTPAPSFRSASLGAQGSQKAPGAQKMATMFNPPSMKPTSASAQYRSAAPAKARTMPWEDLHAPVRTLGKSESTFRNLGGVSGSTSVAEKRRMLSSDTLDIKQKVLLSPEQQMVLKMVVEDGKNVFFTGSAGTGKSVLLREIISALKRKHKGRADAVAVTASTGMAACNVGGTTIHSFAGIGLGTDGTEALIAKVRKNRVAAGKWTRSLVLVIDEVSMVDGFLFDKLAAIACALRKKPNFGGIQLVVTGDFFQLPPVTKGVTPTFAFEAKAWKSCIDNTVNLTQVFRQKDTQFINMLNEMRFGTLSEASIARFKSLDKALDSKDGIEYTELFPMRNDVDKANQARLQSLDGESYVFDAVDWTPYPDSKNTYLDSFMAQKKLTLKIGAQVMLIKNIDATLVNGTIGIVTGFGPLESLDEDDDDTDALKKDKKLAGMGAQASGAGGEKGPIIRWSTPSGFEVKAPEKMEFKVEDVKGSCLAKRTQYPVILAWAMSIHKSQGQTIPRVKVNLLKVFEKGQSYVALSRATSLEGLQVIGFDAKKVMAHPKVTTWSRTLTTLG